MAKADSVHSTPRLNTPISQSPVDATSRRRFLSHAAGIAAGGTVLALATIPPASAGATLASPMDGTNASPALRAAARALDDAHERLKAASAANDAAYTKADAWLEENPEPKSKRGRKRWIWKTQEHHYEVTQGAWVALQAAEKDFRAAQIAVAKVKPRDLADLELKAVVAAIYDDIELSCINRAPISRVVAFEMVQFRLAVTS
jgi:hypothetical protein